jgi:hypothetical protein
VTSAIFFPIRFFFHAIGSIADGGNSLVNAAWKDML